MNRTVETTNQGTVVEGGFCLHCIECDALLSEYRLAAERYMALCGMLGTPEIPEASPDPTFQELKSELAEARLNCHRTRNALSTHRETEVCHRSRPAQHQYVTVRELVAALRLQNPVT